MAYALSEIHDIVKSHVPAFAPKDAEETVPLEIIKQAHKKALKQVEHNKVDSAKLNSLADLESYAQDVHKHRYYTTSNGAQWIKGKTTFAENVKKSRSNPFPEPTAEENAAVYALLAKELGYSPKDANAALPFSSLQHLHHAASYETGQVLSDYAAKHHGQRYFDGEQISGWVGAEAPAKTRAL